MAQKSPQKAYIKKLVLQNYKKYSECTVEFSDGLNILVGPNNAGKTTILEAIDILLGERNLSPSSIKRNLFHEFTSGENNSAKLILAINYPPNCGQQSSEINFVKQLKTGKGSSRSKISCQEIQSHITIENILFEENIGEYYENLSKGGYDINEIFLVTEISVDKNYIPEITYDIYLNVQKDSEKKCYRVVGITGSQRASLFNYLFLPANRINNKSLTEITDFNWIGRYIRGYINKHRHNRTLSKFKDNHSFPQEILDPNSKSILNKLFTSHEKISIDLINKADEDSIVTNSRFYLEDGFNDEIGNKGQGIQSASIISLFAGWSKFQSENVPKNSKVKRMWNTVLSLEEPESHFHFPIRNKLLKILNEEFLEHGAQVFISTHDNTFINWQYINKGTLIFPSSNKDNNISTLQLSEITDENTKRIVRFNGESFFTDIVLIVEGQEDITINLLSQLITSKSFDEYGIILTRSVGGIRKNGDEMSDKQQLGGSSQISENIAFFQKLNIETICLLDIDVLFNNGSVIRDIYKQKTGSELKLSTSYINNITCPKKYLKLSHWWKANKNNVDLINDLKQLEQVGIFIFPGDFESLFNEEYLSKFERPDDINSLIKEKFAYHTKFAIELTQEGFIKDISEEGIKFLTNLINKIDSYTDTYRTTQSKSKEQDSLPNVDVEQDNDFPFK